MVRQSESGESGYRERNSTADRALVVLQMFSDDRLVLSGAEISQGLGVARSTAYRYLQSLLAAGFLEDGAGGFRLGPRVLELARLARKGMGVSEIALPVMRRLAEESHETVLLTRRSGDVVVCLDLIRSDRAVQISYDRGHVLPINAGAAAEVLVAWESPDTVRAILSRTKPDRFTDKTLTDPDDFLARLEAIRERGVAISRGELDQDVTGIAAPIFGANGSVQAAISIAALTVRMPAESADAATAAVVAAAEEISHRFALMDH